MSIADGTSYCRTAHRPLNVFGSLFDTRLETALHGFYLGSIETSADYISVNTSRRPDS
jgi:hypothetical protein